MLPGRRLLRNFSKCKLHLHNQLLYEPGLRRTHADMAELERRKANREHFAPVPPQPHAADADPRTYSREHVDLSEIRALPVLRSIFNDLTLKRPNLKDALIFMAKFDSCLQDTFDLLHGAKIYKTGTPYLVYITLKIIWVRESKCSPDVDCSAL